MKNPLKSAANLATVKNEVEPHAKGLHKPREKDKHAHKGRMPAELPRSHGLRSSAKGRDMLQSSNKGPKLPGRMEPSGITRPGPGPKMFGDQGSRGR